MKTDAPASDLERRKHVRLNRRPDLQITPQKYEGKTFYVVKDPVSLRYYRFKEQEHFLLTLMDGKHTLDESQKAFEKRFRPERLTLEDLEQFGHQLINAGLVQNESPQAGKQLYQNRNKRKRMERLQMFTNILYIKIPVFDPERILALMLPWLWWMFTKIFLLASVAFMASAASLVLTHFDVFYSKLPSYHEFFSFKTVFYLWFALGAVKIIHEFGHGLSCKAFGGEVHEMGFLLLCLSPAMYCNVSDAWTLPNKWHRIIISAAGIYVELMIAAAATFVWWNTPSQPFVNNMALSLMIVCSVSTVLFNGNPLMRYDGYYVLADWIEIPNLRDRANRYLQNLAMEYCLGIEVQPEPYMETGRKVLFVIFAVISYFYRWIVTFVILQVMATFLRPYKLEVISSMLALVALGSMIGWPMYRLIKNVNKRGRLPDMKTARVTATAGMVALLLLFAFFVPLPVTRVREIGLVQPQPTHVAHVPVDVPGQLVKIHVREGEFVRRGKVLAEFTSLELDKQRVGALADMDIQDQKVKEYDRQINATTDARERARLQDYRTKADSDYRQAYNRYKVVEKEMELLTLRAPRDGVVIGLPQIDEVGKTWDKDQSTPFCSLGDRTRLRVAVPVGSADYDLIRDNLKKYPNRKLLATIRVQGLGARTYTGYVADLPASEAREIPPALSSKAGGPLAVKPSNDPNQFVPQAQVFLVGVDIENPEGAIGLGTMAQVKIHNEYRSAAWWTWRTIAATFDLPLL